MEGTLPSAMRRYTENCPRWCTMSININQRKSSRRTSPIVFGATKNFTVLFRSASLALRTVSPSVRNARSHSETRASHCAGGAGSFGGNSSFPSARLLLPRPGVPQAARRVNLLIGTGHAMQGAVGRLHVNPVAPADPQVDLGQGGGHVARRAPTLQGFRLRPGLEDFFRRRRERAREPEGDRVGELADGRLAAPEARQDRAHV